MNPTSWKLGKEKERVQDEIEKLLWEVPQMLLELRLQGVSSCTPNYQDADMPKPSGTSDSTGNYATKNMSSDCSVFGQTMSCFADDPTFILCKEIEEIFLVMQEELQVICEMYFFQKKLPSEISRTLNMSYRTFRRKLHEALYFFQKNIVLR